VHRLLIVCILVGLAGGAKADGSMPVKAPPPAALSGWSGLYVGAHFGYAGGTSDWSANGVAPGTLQFFNGYNPFKGTGSYFAGLQGATIT